MASVVGLSQSNRPQAHRRLQTQQYQRQHRTQQHQRQQYPLSLPRPATVHCSKASTHCAGSAGFLRLSVTLEMVSGRRVFVQWPPLPTACCPNERERSSRAQALPCLQSLGLTAMAKLCGACSPRQLCGWVRWSWDCWELWVPRCCCKTSLAGTWQACHGAQAASGCTRYASARHPAAW